MNDIVVICIKRKEGTLDIRAKLIPDELKTYYGLLDCSTIDIVRRSVGDKIYSFIVDDEYLLTHEVLEPPVAIGDHDEAIYGALVVAGDVDQDGNLTSLNYNEDLNNVAMNIGHFRGEHKDGFPNLEPIFRALKYSF